jgi:subtilisin family serine protease
MNPSTHVPRLSCGARGGRRRRRTTFAWSAAVLLLSGLLPLNAQVAHSKTTSPADATFYKAQWNLKAIRAHAAFSIEAEASTSREVLVAVLDTGIDYNHPDLVGRVDLELSTSLIGERAAPGSTCLTDPDPHEPSVPVGVPEPGVPYGANRMRDPIEENAVAAGEPGGHEVIDFHSHGTAVSGLIASNAQYLAGVTQETTVFGVKVHGMGRQNCLSVYLAGVYEAADKGADVIHLSFPLEFNTDPNNPSAGPAFPEAVGRINDALDYAHEQGAVLVAAAGNNTANLDLGTTFRFCEGAHVICVSATGPTSMDAVEEPHWDQFVANSNFGEAIDVAGPGGTAAVPVTLTCSLSTRFGGAPQAPCRAGAKVWQSTGTSFGAAATSGLAALVVRLSGSADPLEIEEIIESSADDLGTEGHDPYFGEGRINVKAAVGLATR